MFTDTRICILSLDSFPPSRRIKGLSALDLIYLSHIDGVRVRGLFLGNLLNPAAVDLELEPSGLREEISDGCLGRLPCVRAFAGRELHVSD